MRLLRIATRESPLALWQAEFVAAALRRQDPELRCELVPMRTAGDRWLAGALATQGGKGLFVKELETALIERRADLAVHSLKDVPAELPPGLALVAYLARHTPHDALVGCASLQALAPAAVVGTASQRRAMLLLAHRPDLQIRLLRGNVNTRLAKLDAGEYAAIVLAASGLERLGMAERIGTRLPLDWMTPAPGQGILALEARADDAALAERVARLNDEASAYAAEAERALSRALGGSCALPLAGHCTQADGGWVMRAALGLPDGTQVVRAARQGTADLPGPELGARLAEDLRAAGGTAVLEVLGAGSH